MERRRQLPQDLTIIHGVQLHLDSNYIATCSEDKVEKIIAVPSRVEGRTVRQAVEVSRLVDKQTYRTVQAYLEDQQPQRDLYAHSEGVAWTLADIPADVRATCDTYMCEYQQRYNDWSAVLDDHCMQSIDRMTAMQDCPNCLGRQQYGCYTCGYSRKLYTYPLLYLRDPVSDAVFEVPYDVGLYLHEKPLDQRLNVKYALSNVGRLTASYQLDITPTVFSTQYVRTVTNGAITPDTEGLLYAEAPHYMNIELARWSEISTDTVCDTLSSEDLLERAQRQVMTAWAERVTDIDYNHLHQTVQRMLGSYGLRLFYEWEAAGMGDWNVIFSALPESGEQMPIVQAIGGDVYDTLSEFADQISKLPDAEEGD